MFNIWFLLLIYGTMIRFFFFLYISLLSYKHIKLTYSVTKKKNPLDSFALIIMSSVNKQFYFFLYMLFSPIGRTWTSNAMLMEIVRLNILVLFLIQEECIQLFILHWIWCYCSFFWWISLISLKKLSSFYSYFAECFFKSGMDVRSFQIHLLRWTMVFLFQFINMEITFVDFWMLYQSCIPGINLTWSWYIILFFCVLWDLTY